MVQTLFNGGAQKGFLPLSFATILLGLGSHIPSSAGIQRSDCIVLLLESTLENVQLSPDFHSYVPQADRPYSSGYVFITGPAAKKLDFERTNRGVNALLHERHYRPEVLTEQYLNGRKVLDIGTGDGQTVMDFRDLGAKAYGIDLVLRKHQRELSYFFEGKSTRLPFVDGEMDYVYSSMSIFSAYYHLHISEIDLKQSIKEVVRVLRVGGTFHFSNPGREAIENLDQTPEMKLIKSTGNKYYEPSAGWGYAEYQKLETKGL